jgi:hypothetical protein
LIPEDDQQQAVTDLPVTAADPGTGRALRAAAATIGQMPDAELQCKLSQLKKARRARSPHEVLRQQAELDSLELDEAAYKLASRAHRDGNLPEAARWYRAGAINDFAEAPLKLAMVLDSLAAKHLARPESPAAMREELGLVTEAALWYLMAFRAGDIEAAELLDTLIARHDRRACTALAADEEDPGAGTCMIGGLRSVMELPPAEATAHCGSCRACKAELVKLRPLMDLLGDQPAIKTADDRGDSPHGDRGPRHSPAGGGPALRPEQSKPGRSQLVGSSQNCNKEG